MPHLSLEYTAGLDDFDAPDTLARLNQVMFDSGLFAESDIKSRAFSCEDYRIGVSDQARHFIHVCVALLSGRSSEQKTTLSQGLLEALEAVCNDLTATEIQISVEMVDIDRESYAKRVHRAH